MQMDHLLLNKEKIKRHAFIGIHYTSIRIKYKNYVATHWLRSGQETRRNHVLAT